MIKADFLCKVMELPEDERLEIADAIWASLDNSDSNPLPFWQRDLLDERLVSLGSEEGRDWEDVKAEIWPPSR
jgi:putative addiction module component (TIGR02574 family)